MNEKRERELLAFTTDWLVQERRQQSGCLPAFIPSPRASLQELWACFRALVNTREPLPADKSFLAAQDELLQGIIANRGVIALTDTQPSSNNPRMRLVQGDITLLATDAIVNAANSGMTGCWQPLHSCIDNAIHTFAGIQLRLECAEAMERQGHPEPTAHARVTQAYNLPCQRIIHTVGPIAQGFPSKAQNQQLTQCYTACLDAASEHNLSSIAFCCISTGVFGFPQKEAAQIAVATVQQWLADHPSSEITVVFDVFLDEDKQIYSSLLGMDNL